MRQRNLFFLTMLPSVIIVSVRSIDDQRWIDHDDQMRLLDYLLNRPPHEKLARPVAHGQGTLNISIRMSLYQIVNVDEPCESISINVWIEEVWNDVLLAWNPADYGNITSVVIPVFSVWMPDTYLYNGLVMKREDSERLSNMEVVMEYKTDPHRAKVLFRHPTIYTFSCKMNVRYFPFDIQNCSMIFGSWVHDATFLDYFTDNAVDLAPYVENEEWSIISFEAYRHVIKYECCENPYTNIQFHLVISRRPLYVLVNLVSPILLITLVSLIGFFSPDSIKAERSEKVTLAVNTLLAMSVMLLMVTEKMPTTSNFVPLMGLFFLFVITLISVASIATTFIIQLQRNNRCGEAVSGWWRTFLFRFLASLVGIAAEKALYRFSRTYSENSLCGNNVQLRNHIASISTASNCENNSAAFRRQQQQQLSRSRSSIPQSCNSLQRRESKQSHAITLSLHEKLDEVATDVSDMGRRVNEAKELSPTAYYYFEWDLAATIVEKFLLYLFVAILVAGTGAMMGTGWLIQKASSAKP